MNYSLDEYQLYLILDAFTQYMVENYENIDMTEYWKIKDILQDVYEDILTSKYNSLIIIKH